MLFFLNTLSFYIFLQVYWVSFSQILRTDQTWTELVDKGNSKWSPRNAHASCSFLGKLWVIGGYSDTYPMFNLIYSQRNNDVWNSINGISWVRETALLGDFYAQNWDALQPGPVAPFFPRYGHSVNVLDITGDGVDDLMILVGGYAPKPMNDVWITPDGITWAYVGGAPWAPRAWHASCAFNGTLWIMGGTPISNDIWYTRDIKVVPRKVLPLTRSLYLDYQYEVVWHTVGEAVWSPRMAMGLVAQYIMPNYETNEPATYRMVLIGGYGGYLDHRSDGGLRCRSDVWSSYDGKNWTLVTKTAPFGGLAWMGAAAWNPNGTAYEKCNIYERILFYSCLLFYSIYNKDV